MAGAAELGKHRVGELPALGVSGAKRAGNLASSDQCVDELPDGAHFGEPVARRQPRQSFGDIASCPRILATTSERHDDAQFSARVGCVSASLWALEEPKDYAPTLSLLKSYLFT